MSHATAQMYLVWSLLASIFMSFMVFHLWSFDRFQCLKWNSGPYSGAFKRLMTYAYLVNVPLISAYAIGFAVIKYKMGYMTIPGFGIIPTPYQLWPEHFQNMIFPLLLVFAVGWSFEIVIHLEELCFWLFLVNSGGSGQQDWFKSPYFKIWVTGSTAALIYMPVVTTLTRGDLLRCEAVSIFSGSIGSLVLTLWFIPILFTFPNFLAGLKKEGVDISTIVRLTKFHEMNTLRVMFRLLFSVCLVTLGADGLTAHRHINENMFWTDLLGMLAGFGVVISSALTLVIFFPRSIETEIRAKEATRERKMQSTFSQSRARATPIQTQSLGTASNFLVEDEFMLKSAHALNSDSPLMSPSSSKGGLRRWEEETPKLSKHAPRMVNIDWAEEEQDEVPPGLPKYSSPKAVHHDSQYIARNAPRSVKSGHDSRSEHGAVSREQVLRPNRRANNGDDVELGGIGSTEGKLKFQEERSNVNHLVHNFKSPIDVVSGGSQPTPRYTFKPPR